MIPTIRFRLLLLQHLLLVLILQQFSTPIIIHQHHHSVIVVDAALPCTEDSFCEQMLRPGSYCIIENNNNDDNNKETTTTTTTTTTTGVCSNPFTQGCLKTLLPEKLKKSSNNNNNNNDEKNIHNLIMKIEKFHTLLKGRICNSDDDNNDDVGTTVAAAVVDGNVFDNDNRDESRRLTSSTSSTCQIPLFDYPEIRIHNSNWESSIFLSWIFQIVLMEILEVPVTIGLGPSGVGPNSGIQDNTYDASFYNPYNIMSYSSEAYPWEALQNANKIHDCNRARKVIIKESNEDEDEETNSTTTTTISTTEPCAHVLPEIWNGQEKEWHEAIRDGYIDPLEENGQVAKTGWYVPRHTVSEYDNTLISYYGIRGEENRHKVAAAFKRPVQWKYYCENISSTNCTVPDTIATHYPLSEEEQSSYYTDLYYTGYFHLSDKNNCTKNPTTCTGVIIGPQCQWSMNIDAQIRWNNLVGLEQDGPIEPHGGYSYSSMQQIWRAANATQSNVIMWWWKPNALVEDFFNSTYEFKPFLLPEPTLKCARARVDTEARCSNDISVRSGLQEGSCGTEPHALYKAYSKSLREMTLQQSNLVYRSPAYRTIQNLRISDLQIGNILRRWIEGNIDNDGYDPRLAVCSWVVDNIDYILDAIPEGFPRTLLDDEEQHDRHNGFRYTAIAVSSFTNLVVWLSLFATYKYRNTRVMQFAQVYFLKIILIGYGLISIASILILLQPPTDLRCTIVAWLVSLGYMIELVPLLVKIAAINRVQQKAATKTKRVIIEGKTMAQTVMFFVLLVVVYLTVWTIVDPLSAVEELTLGTNSESSSSSSELNNNNNHNHDTTGYVISNVQCYCNYYIMWSFIILGIQAILLVMASVLAFQSRNVEQTFNETKYLGVLVYSHFMFLLLRIIITIIDESPKLNSNDNSNSSSNNNGEQIFSSTIISIIFSLLYSFDTLAAVCIYILPKVKKAATTTENDQIRMYRNSVFKGHFGRSMAVRKKSTKT